MALNVQGMTLAIGDGASPEAFTTISGVSNLAGPTGGRELIDVTAINSTGKEYLVGLVDYGDITSTLFYEPANTQHALLWTAFIAAGQTTTNFRITFTDSPATTYTFAALVQGFPHDFAADAAVSVNLTLKISGAITKA